jgi:hypothetical protein
VLSGCTALFNVQHIDPPIDAAPCQFSQLVDTCALGDPSLWQPAVSVTNGETADATLFDVYRMVTIDGVDVKVVAVQSLYIQAGAGLAVTGARPFVIVSYGDVMIDGTLRDSGSSRTPGECGPSGGAAGIADAGGGGGGGGGAFGGAGGGGGSGDSDGAHAAGGPGGTANTAVGRLVGGCPGGDGGAGGTMPGGKGGDGGGAIALVSRTSLEIGGVIVAPGKGGRGGVGNGVTQPFYATGGGGGGTGGMIYLEAPQITGAGSLLANGGGGGEGGAGGDGRDGTDGDTTGSGGAGGENNGGDGGAGGSASHPGGYSSTDYKAGAGGGGGGGVGRIVIAGTSMITGTVSPSPSPPP